MGFQQTPQTSAPSRSVGGRDTQKTPSANSLELPGNATTKNQMPSKRKSNPSSKNKKRVSPGDFNEDAGTPMKAVKKSAAYKGLMSNLNRGHRT